MSLENEAYRRRVRDFLARHVPAGFLAAWPVNYWLLSRNLKRCH